MRRCSPSIHSSQATVSSARLIAPGVGAATRGRCGVKPKASSAPRTTSGQRTSWLDGMSRMVSLSATSVLAASSSRSSISASVQNFALLPAIA
ncbi:MAG TPA: hypothetical protein VGO34_00575 [Alphaproteobacteria bacterium]|jgi:hypothetical protein